MPADDEPTMPDLWRRALDAPRTPAQRVRTVPAVLADGERKGRAPMQIKLTIDTEIAGQPRAYADSEYIATITATIKNASPEHVPMILDEARAAAVFETFVTRAPVVEQDARKTMGDYFWISKENPERGTWKFHARQLYLD